MTLFTFTEVQLSLSTSEIHMNTQSSIPEQRKPHTNVSSHFFPNHLQRDTYKNKQNSQIMLRKFKTTNHKVDKKDMNDV